MQIAAETTTSPSLRSAAISDSSATSTYPHFFQYKVICRNGAVVGFEPSKISAAVTKGFLAANGGQSVASARIRELVGARKVGAAGTLMRRQPAGGTFHIQDIQDQVEVALMRSGAHNAAKACVLYRGKRAQARAQVTARTMGSAATKVAAPGPAFWRVR